MIYIPVTSTNIYQNFALEYFLAAEKRFKEPVFMLWSTTPTVMLGKYQDALAELNLNYIQQQSIQVVRRYSGGGTIYTDAGGCQFSFIQPQSTTTISFDTYIETIQQALLDMNISAEKTSRNDLTIKEKKFSGNAQYNHQGYTVHHGSILFDTDLEQMYDALHVDDMKLRSKHIASIRQHTINLKTIRPDLTMADFKTRLIRNVRATFAQHDTYHLTAAERQRVMHLAETLFEDESFIFGKTPHTEISKKHYFPGGGLVQFDLNVNHGILTDLRLTGDFFSNLDASHFAQQLIGRPFRPATLKRPIQQALAAYPILGIQTEDLLDLLFS
ncbi:lipoate--protein ligase [Agrilactobacillus yilanensis]|uniref:lipoate--protein ligase n=1 Tax=Agrilactobacillus yilanensis TaxID=2485997 RepID=A0ABW4J874_9LACO|nr:lipoate--protein ligase [Agrilactobacillus yilanensis]